MCLSIHKIPDVAVNVSLTWMTPSPPSPVPNSAEFQVALSPRRTEVSLPWIYDQMSGRNFRSRLFTYHDQEDRNT